MSQDQDIVSQVLSHEIKAPEIAIPAAAQAEIKKLHLDLVAKAKAFETARGAFGEFVRVTRRTLQVPDEGRWEIKEDASAFLKVPEGADANPRV